MVEVRTRRPVAPDDVATLRALADRAERRDGHPSLGDAVWHALDAEHATDSTLLLAVDAGQTTAALHLHTPPDGLATAGIVVDPEHRETDVGAALAAEAVRVAEVAGSRHLALWIFGADERADALAVAVGLDRERELWQMRVPLPIADRTTLPEGIALRAFVPGRDDQQWLDVNNRAFAHDPDQRGWSHEQLGQRMREPWFDPDGFLLATEGDRIVGFCWTKVHPPAPPHEPHALGEIYVIGVDPDRQSLGLGRALVTSGLRSLHDRGIDVGMLFVDAANTAATALYRSLGFVVTRQDRAYGRDLQ